MNICHNICFLNKNSLSFSVLAFEKLPTFHLCVNLLQIKDLMYLSLHNGNNTIQLYSTSSLHNGSSALLSAQLFEQIFNVSKKM